VLSVRWNLLSCAELRVRCEFPSASEYTPAPKVISDRPAGCEPQNTKPGAQL
jgi:hypothetical protein